MDKDIQILEELTLSLIIPSKYHLHIKEAAKKNKQNITQYISDLICNSIEN